MAEQLVQHRKDCNEKLDFHWLSNEAGFGTPEILFLKHAPRADIIWVLALAVISHIFESSCSRNTLPKVPSSLKLKG